MKFLQSNLLLCYIFCVVSDYHKNIHTSTKNSVTISQRHSYLMNQATQFCFLTAKQLFIKPTRFRSQLCAQLRTDSRHFKPCVTGPVLCFRKSRGLMCLQEGERDSDNPSRPESYQRSMVVYASAHICFENYLCGGHQVTYLEMADNDATEYVVILRAVGTDKRLGNLLGQV